MEKYLCKKSILNNDDEVIIEKGEFCDGRLIDDMLFINNGDDEYYFYDEQIGKYFDKIK